MINYVITSTVSGIWTVSALILYPLQYGWSWAAFGLGLLGLGIFVMNIDAAVKWYDEGEMP